MRDIVSLDSRRYGAWFIRADFAVILATQTDNMAIYPMKMPLRSAFVIAAITAVFSPASAADSAAIVGELKSCARIDARDARVACYEVLGKRAIQDETSTVIMPSTVRQANTTPNAAVGSGTVSAAATASTPAAPSAQPTMTDSMGGYQYAEKSSDHPDNDIYTRVIQCQQDMDKVWFFKFENGQVWKQVDRAARHFNDCDFPVVLSKDGFGYKMQIEGKGSKIRISRRK